MEIKKLQEISEIKKDIVTKWQDFFNLVHEDIGKMWLKEPMEDIRGIRKDAERIRPLLIEFFKEKKESAKVIEAEGCTWDLIALLDLNKIRRPTYSWVKQVQKDIRKIIVLGEEIRFSEAAKKTEFPEVLKNPYSIGEINGDIYVRKLSRPKAGVVVVHGIFSNTMGLQLLCKRLAGEGYAVYTFNLPSRLGTEDIPFRLGTISEYIFRSVRMLRSTFNVKKVAVVGHSTGAMGTLFAMLGYNLEIENEIFKKMESILRHVNDAINMGLVGELAECIAENKEYNELKQIILKSLRSQVFNQGRINAVVVISAPRKYQVSNPVIIARLASVVPQEWFKWWRDKGNKALEKITEKKYKDKRYVAPNMDEGKVVWEYLVVSDIKAFMTYIATVKNPCDYMGLIDFFSSREYEAVREKEERMIREREERALKDRVNRSNSWKNIAEMKYAEEKPITTFMRAYRKRVIEIMPKLFMYGTKDFVIRAMFPGETRKLEKLYQSFGNAKIVHYKTKHLFNEVDEEGNETEDVEAVKSPKAVAEILAFLDETLR